MVAVDTSFQSRLAVAFRRLRDPLLLFVVPVTFAFLSVFVGWDRSWPIGFDFRGTLWEPANAVLDGAPIYPVPIRDSIVVGNPSVYPPLFILLTIPLALVPVTVAAWLWFCVLGVAVFAALWIVGLRDWRCHVLALTSPMTLQGLFFGNLTVLLVLALALLWRYRDRALIAGLAVGAAVAAKLFIWPLVVWLLLTRRFAAAAYAVVSAAILVFGAWAVIGFEGLADYPELLRAVQDVYALRSVSLASALGGLGASVTLAVVLTSLAGIGCLAVAGWLVWKGAGDRASFAVVVATCVIASPIVWPNYTALLFVPIAIIAPRLSLPWFFGYAIWIAGVLAPKPAAVDACCRPAGVPEQAWAWSHSAPVLWYAAGLIAVVAFVAVILVIRERQNPSWSTRGEPVAGTI